LSLSNQADDDEQGPREMLDEVRARLTPPAPHPNAIQRSSRPLPVPAPSPLLDIALFGGIEEA